MEFYSQQKHGIYVGISPEQHGIQCSRQNTIGCDIEIEWMLAHKKNQRSWVGNDPQQEPHILGQKDPIMTDIIIGWVLAHNNKKGY